MSHKRSPHHSLPFEFRVPEVQQQCEIKVGDVQVAEHLSDVIVIERGDYLRINDDQFIDDQIRNKCPDQMSVPVF